MTTAAAASIAARATGPPSCWLSGRSPLHTEAAGALLPGETSLIVASALVGSGRFSLRLVIAVAAGAAIVGDNVGCRDARGEANDGCWDYQTRDEPACWISTVC
jgi:hypothetical protein